MRALAIAAAFLGLVSSAQVAPRTFRVEPIALAAGDRTTSSLRWRSELAYRVESADGVVQSYSEVEGAHVDVTLEVLALERLEPTALRVDVATATSVESDGEGGVRDERLPIAERGFEARRDAGAWHVVDGEQRAISPAVAALVLRAADVEGERCLPVDARLARELAGRDLVVGASFELSPATARALVGRDSEVTSIAARLVPMELRAWEGADVRPFRCTVEIVLESADAFSLDARATLDGELVLDARTGRLGSLELRGKTRVAAAASGDRALEVTAEGPWTVSRRAATLTPR